LSIRADLARHFKKIPLFVSPLAPSGLPAPQTTTSYKKINLQKKCYTTFYYDKLDCHSELQHEECDIL